MTVYEREPKFGGTTALSGGNAWLPGHAGLPDDSAELGLTYLRELSLGDADDELLQVFAREAGPTAARVERDTPLRLQAIPYCDYHAERPGGREQGGRTLEPVPYDPSREDRRRSCATRRTSPARSPTSSWPRASTTARSSSAAASRAR